MSSSLFEEAINLQRAAHELMYLGMDGSPIYSDDLSRRNGEVYRLTAALYGSSARGTTTEEQANVCLALLMGYNASFIDHGEKQDHLQEILNRCWNLLDPLPASLLKLRPVSYTHLRAHETARKIISSWDSASLTAEQQEAVEEFRNVVNNPYPWEYLED